MKVLIIGNGGREHVIATAYANSKKVTTVFVAPGNDFMPCTNKKIKTLPSIGVLDFDAILRFAKKENIDFIDVAQDDPLANGLVDVLQEKGFQVFGPTQKAAQLEWSKEWSRSFMQKYKLPIPTFHAFTNPEHAITFIETNKEQLFFIKASGLALGKGVIRADTKQQAIAAIKSMKQFGKSGETFLIEEGLIGEEFTLFVLCDGENYVITKSSQDHKTIYNGDTGPNTGGVGCVSPTTALTKKLLQEIGTTIIKPTLKGMQKEGRPYTGVLYIGGMITKSGVKIIEFNARWGDPEAEVILPSIQTDYLTVTHAVVNKTLAKTKIVFDEKIRISVTGCARGYPQDYSAVKGKEIFGIEQAMTLQGIQIFGSGITREGNRFFVNGGRVFHLVAEGKTVTEARCRAYQAMSLIYIENNNLHYRTDIGWRELQRKFEI